MAPLTYHGVDAYIYEQLHRFYFGKKSNAGLLNQLSEHFLYKENSALWLSWEMGSKVVNFDKLFLQQFSTKIYQALRDDV